VASSIAVALVLAFAASVLLGRRLAAPIATLVAFTQDLAARRFDRRPDVATGDELDVLARALGDAAGALDRSEKREREDAAIRADLGRYLPAEIVEAIVRREQSMELGGRRLPITVLFADVVAFTPLSERLPPEQVVALLNELFTLLTEAVFRHGGTVDKLIGDCVMAIWGAPTPHADHARRAVLAAQDMVRFCESANADWKQRFGVEVRLAIGINTGEAVVGNIGSRERMDYTAIGDVVNVAARLETIARPQQILVSRATADAITGGFDVTPLGPREVPGRKEPVELFEVTW
jgi:class 3 adenylate cyclase